MPFPIPRLAPVTMAMRSIRRVIPSRPMRWLAVIPGVLLIVGTALSVLRSLVVPRASRNVLMNVVGGKCVGPLFRWAAFRRTRWVDQERVLAYAGPTALLVLFATWLVGFYLGYTLVLWPVDHVAFAGA